MPEPKHNIPVQVDAAEVDQPKLYEFGLGQLDGPAVLASFDKEHGFRVKSLEDFQSCPTDKRGAYRFNDIESYGRFIQSVHDECDLGDEHQTRLYRLDSFVTAVFDDHGVRPGRREFKAMLEIPFHEDFEAWTSAHRKKLQETEFIEFIALQKHNALEPDPAPLYDAVSKLDIESFRKRTSDTGSLSRKDTAEATVRVRSEVPETIKVRCFVFDDFAVEIKLRLHVGVDANLGVSFRLVIEGYQKLMNLVNQEIADRVEKVTGIKPLHGVHG